MGDSAVATSGYDCVMANALPRYEVAPDGSSITFVPCQTTSYNADDIKHRYCAKCHRFIGDLWLFSIGHESPKKSTK